MSNTLFDTDANAPDPVYSNVRDGDSEPLISAKAFTEYLWSKYYPFADQHFRREVQSNFNQRFWEMYLGCSLLNKGFEISSADEGPDIRIEAQGKSIWIEAIAPGGGDISNPDAVPEPDWNSGSVYDVPSNEIDLRLLGAIRAKGVEQFERHQNRGYINSTDCYVIAINSRDIPHTIADYEPPRIVRVLFGIGNQTITIDQQRNILSDTGYTPRPSIVRRSGSKIDAALFCTGTYSQISAVLFSRSDAANGPETLGSDYVLVHNPHATNLLPHGLFKMGREYIAQQNVGGIEFGITDHRTE